MTALLPTEFADLEPFAVQWCLPTEAERYAARLASTMPALQALYDAVTPRAEAAITYCAGFPIDELPEQAQNLMYLLYSYIQASFPVEAWRQPRVPGTGATTFDCYAEPVP